MGQLSIPKPIIVAAHAVIMLAAYTSPLWLSWELIALGVILYWIQLLVFGGCILTIAQFNTKDESFSLHYFEKLTGLKVARQKAHFFMNYTLPVIFVLLAILLQFGLNLPAIGRFN